MAGFDLLNVLEAEAMVRLQQFIRTPWLDKAMTVYTRLNDSGALVIAICGVLLLPKKYRDVGVRAAFALSLETIVVNFLLKPLVGRTRPFIVNDAIEVLTRTPHDFSFPSGHTGSMVAVCAVILFCMDKKYGIIAIMAALLMAFSRVYVGVHYPTDVFASIVLGLVIAVFAVRSMDRFEKRKSLDEGTEATAS